MRGTFFRGGLPKYARSLFDEADATPALNRLILLLCFSTVLPHFVPGSQSRQARSALWHGHPRVAQVEVIPQGQHGSWRAGFVLRRLILTPSGTVEVRATFGGTELRSRFEQCTLEGGLAGAAVPALKQKAESGC